VLAEEPAAAAAEVVGFRVEGPAVEADHGGALGVVAGKAIITSKG
jgi:hypothetical protein